MVPAEHGHTFPRSTTTKRKRRVASICEWDARPVSATPMSNARAGIASHPRLPILMLPQSGGRIKGFSMFPAPFRAGGRPRYRARTTASMMAAATYSFCSSVMSG